MPSRPTLPRLGLACNGNGAPLTALLRICEANGRVRGAWPLAVVTALLRRPASGPAAGGWPLRGFEPEASPKSAPTRPLGLPPRESARGSGSPPAGFRVKMGENSAPRPLCRLSLIGIGTLGPGPGEEERHPTSVEPHSCQLYAKAFMDIHVCNPSNDPCTHSPASSLSDSRGGVGASSMWKKLTGCPKAMQQVHAGVPRRCPTQVFPRGQPPKRSLDSRWTTASRGHR